MTREGKKREGKEHKEIIKSYKEKKFGMSLQGLDIWKVGHRPGESLTLLNVLGINTKIRIKNSLADTELDKPRIRIGGRDTEEESEDEEDDDKVEEDHDVDKE